MKRIQYDLLIVGAGITAATLAARLKDRLRIGVIDCRPHIGGNCFDEISEGTLIHRYGPHIFHCPSPRIITFLNSFTEWIPYTHRVIAEIRDGAELRYVPFPYSLRTAAMLGRELQEAEVIDKFFRGYSQKMWGMPWEMLPQSIRGRVPVSSSEEPVYYRDPFVALPRHGYTRMIENMLDGTDVILGAPLSEWTRLRAGKIIYTGRPDLIPMPGDSVSMGQRLGMQLEFRTLNIQFNNEPWARDASSLHACTLERPWTRKTCFSQMTGGYSQVVSTEIPVAASTDDPTPYYPMEIPRNQEIFACLSAQIRECYPNLYLAGRLGSYRYFDMYQAVGQALTLADRLWSTQRESARRVI